MKNSLINYYDYCLGAKYCFEGAEENSISQIVLGASAEYLGLSLALQRSDKESISKKAGGVARNLGHHSLMHLDPSDQFFQILKKIWWEPKYTSTLPSSETITLESLLEQYVSICLKYIQSPQSVVGYHGKIKNLLIKMNESLVIITQNSSITPLQILIDDINGLCALSKGRFEAYLFLDQEMIEEYKPLHIKE